MPQEVEVEGLGTVEFPDGMKPQEIESALSKHFVDTMRTADAADTEAKRNAPPPPSTINLPSPEEFSQRAAEFDKQPDTIPAGATGTDAGVMASGKFGPPPEPPSRMEQWIRGAARLPQAPPQFEHLTPEEKDQFAGWAGAYNDADKLTDHNLDQEEMLKQERSLAATYPKEHRDKLLAAISDLAEEKKSKDQFGVGGRTVAAYTRGAGEAGSEISDIIGQRKAGGSLPPLSLEDQRFAGKIQQAREQRDPLNPYAAYDPRSWVVGTAHAGVKLAGAVAAGPAGAAVFAPGMYQAGRREGYSPATSAISAAGQTALFGGALRAVMPAAGAAESVENDLAQTFLQRAGAVGKGAAIGAAKGTGLMTLAEVYNQAVQATADKVSGTQGPEVGERVQRVLEAAKSGAGMSLLLGAVHAAPEFTKAVLDRSKNGMISKTDAPESNRDERKSMYEELTKAQSQPPPASPTETPPAQPPEQPNVPQEENVQQATEPQAGEELGQSQPAGPETGKENVGQQADEKPAAVASLTPSPPDDAKTVGIKNRIMDATRATDRGLETPERTPSQSKQQMLDAATAKMRDEPQWVDSLVTELDTKPRNLEPEEIAGLQIRYLDLTSQFGAAVDRQAAARASGDQQALESATAQTSLIAGQLGKFENSVQAGKSQWGRAGHALQIELLRDGSIANLKRQRAAARGGAKLDPEAEAAENEQIASLSKEIADLKAKYDAYVAESADKEMHAKLDAQIAADKAEKSEGKRESMENRSIRLVDAARNAGMEPSELLDAAKERAATINESNAGRNAAYRDAMLKTGMTPEKMKSFTGDWTNIKGFDQIADQLASDYPEYFAGKHGDTADVEAVWAMMQEGIKKDVRWHDVLDDIAPRNPDADVPFSLSSEEDKPAAKPVIKAPAKARKAETRKAIDDALAEYREVTKKNKGIYLGSTKIVPEILLDPERLAKAVKVIKAYVNHGIATLAEVWADAKKSLGLDDEDYPFYVGAWRQAREAGEIPRPIKDVENFDEVSRFARQVQRAVIDAGVGKGLDAKAEREAVVEAVHNELKDVLPEMTPRETKLALSRYGKFRELPKDETSVKIRAINGELQQLLKLEDMEAKHAPLKTGFEQRDPSDEERQLRKQVNEKMKEGGFITTDKEKEQKSALAARKTALRNQITDLEKEIADKQKIVKEKRNPLVDKELTDLRAKLAEVKERHNKAFNKDTELEANRREAYKRNLTKRLEALEKANANKQELVKKPIKKTVLDQQAMDLKGNLEAAWKKQKDIVANIRYSNRSWWEKAMDAVGGTRVAFVLSHLGIIGKLTASAVTQIGTKFGEDVAIGGALRKVPIVKGIMRRASEGGATEGIVDAGAHARGAKAAGAAALAHARDVAKAIWNRTMPPSRVAEAKQLDTTFGRTEQPTGPIEHFIRDVHATLHDPVKIAGYHTDLEKRMASYAKSFGADYVDDPINQLKIANESYQNAQKWIFFQDNEISRRVTGFFRSRIDPKTSKPTPASKAGEVLGRVIVPISKVPFNIIGEAFEHIGGAFTIPTHAGRIIARAYQQGSFEKAVESLTPEQADLIVRHLKRGLAGGALMTLGYFNPGSVGGFYSTSYKPGDDEAEWGTVKLGGLIIPRWMLHNPLFVAMHFGATVRRIQDSYLRQKDVEPRGLPAGIAAASVGVIQDAPVLHEALHLGDLQRDPESWLGKELKSIVVPGVVQDLMTQFSTPDKPAKKPPKPTKHVSYSSGT